MVTVTTTELASEHTDAAAPSLKGGKRILMASPRGYCAGGVAARGARGPGRGPHPGRRGQRKP